MRRYDISHDFYDVSRRYYISQRLFIALYVVGITLRTFKFDEILTVRYFFKWTSYVKFANLVPLWTVKLVTCLFYFRFS